MNRSYRNRRVDLAILVAGAMYFGAAFAQQPGRTPLSENQINTAVTLEAATVAKELNLDAETAGELERAYREARQSHSASAPQPGKDPGAFQAMLKYDKGEREKLEKALKGFLSAEQTNKALSTLGTFNRQWDRMVLTIDGFALPNNEKSRALAEIAAYVREFTRVRDELVSSNAFPSGRDALMKTKEALDEKLGTILSSEQSTQWAQETENLFSVSVTKTRNNPFNFFSN